MKTKLLPRSKYNNRQTVVRGHVFDSKAESERYLELEQWQKEGKIWELKLQPVFVLQESFTDREGKKHRPITYIADFQYIDHRGYVAEDVKGMKTEVYKIKKKLFLHEYINFTLVEI